LYVHTYAGYIIPFYIYSLYILIPYAIYIIYLFTISQPLQSILIHMYISLLVSISYTYIIHSHPIHIKISIDKLLYSCYIYYCKILILCSHPICILYHHIERSINTLINHWRHSHYDTIHTTFKILYCTQAIYSRGANETWFCS
jgi:hypothetical protein